jgi:acylphosphatase
MKRVIVIVKGRVQRVGYRDLVAEIANSLDIGGRAKNLPDGTVRIIAEAEKDVLEKFISLIQPKDDPMIKVTNVDVKFEEPTGKFEYFDIEYEDFDKEGFERIGTAAVYLKRISGTLDGMDKRQDKMLEKQDQTIDMQKQSIDMQKQTLDMQKQTIEEVKTVGNKIDHGFEKMDQNFNRMDVKYDKVSDKMDSIDNTLKKLTEAILKLAEKSGGK